MFKQKPSEAKLFMKKTENEKAKANFFSMGKQRKGTRNRQDTRGKRQETSPSRVISAAGCVVVYV